MRAPLGSFDNAVPAPDCLAELAPPVAEAVRGWAGDVPADQIVYVDTDPAIADTGAFVAHYGPELLDTSANCVVVAAKRGGEVTLAACLVPSAGRVDVNGAVRRHLGARKVSFAPMETAVELTGMEYGASPRSACRPTGRSWWTRPSPTCRTYSSAADAGAASSSPPGSCSGRSPGPNSSKASRSSDGRVRIGVQDRVRASGVGRRAQSIPTVYAAR